MKDFTVTFENGKEQVISAETIEQAIDHQKKCLRISHRISPSNTFKVVVNNTILLSINERGELTQSSLRWNPFN